MNMTDEYKQFVDSINKALNNSATDYKSLFGEEEWSFESPVIIKTLSERNAKAIQSFLEKMVYIPSCDKNLNRYQIRDDANYFDNIPAPHGQTLRRQLQELEELMFRLNKLQHELSDICQRPSWEGCAVGIVDGRTPENKTYASQEYFVLTKDEVPLLNDKDELLRIAMTRVTNLVDLENARFHMPIH